jgi:hypothetical protein
MKSIMHTRALIPCIFLLAVVIASCGASPSGLDKRLKSLGIELKGASGFAIKEDTGLFIKAEKDNEVLRVNATREVDKATAEERIKGQEALLIATFEAQLPPYPEFLTKETGCGEMFKPKKTDTPYGLFYIMYATKRLGYGVCADDLSHFRAGMGLFYVQRTKTLLKIEYFIPKHMPTDALIEFFKSVKTLNQG